MRKLFVILLLCVIGFLPSAVYAGPTYYGEWSVSNVSFRRDIARKIVELKLDITVGNRFLALNGIYETLGSDSKSTYPVSGTAILTETGQILMVLTFGSSFSSSVVLNPDTLNGTIRTFDFDGNQVDEGTVTFLSLE